MPLLNCRACKVSFTTADHHGTALLAIDAATQQLSQRRVLPFGGTRGTEPATWPGTKGFVGGTEDASTGLTHLGAREYDPSTGRFLSVDPVLDLTDPQQINGYTYSNNSPVTFSDPTGLWCDSCNDGKGWPTVDGYEDDKPSKGNTGKGNGNSNAGNGNSSHSPAQTVNVAATDGVIEIENIVVPSARELEAQFPQYSEAERLEAWAERKCYAADANTKAFCGAAEALGIINHEQTLFDKVVVSLVAPDFDAWKSCLSGESLKSCGWAATDLPWARVFKGAKLIKATKKVDDCNSFVPGTEVLMADGTTKPIEDVRIGDEILATDPKTGRTTVKKVTAEIIGEGLKDLVDITLTVDGRPVHVTATDGHPFWVPGSADWIDAGDLKAGQNLRTAAGKNVRIVAVEHRTRLAAVHNLTVADLHTYYVLAGATPVLAHNSGPCPKAVARQNDIAGKFGGVKVDQGFMFPNRRSARQAASEMVGSLGSNPSAIRARDFRGGPYWMKDSDRVIGRQSADGGAG